MSTSALFIPPSLAMQYLIIGWKKNISKRSVKTIWTFLKLVHAMIIQKSKTREYQLYLFIYLIIKSIYIIVVVIHWAWRLLPDHWRPQFGLHITREFQSLDLHLSGVVTIRFYDRPNHLVCKIHDKVVVKTRSMRGLKFQIQVILHNKTHFFEAA